MAEGFQEKIKEIQTKVED